MELVREKLQTQISESEEAQRHNAMIKERYRRLQNAEAGQFAEDTRAEERETETTEVETPSLYISPSAVNTATLEQTPQVTEYVSLSASPLFTTEKFERIKTEERASATVVAPVQSVSTAVATEAQYSLSAFAKIVMTAFAIVIVAMLTLICVNTQLIRQKSVRIQDLEEKKEQLMGQYEELQARIDAARSEEAILEYAQTQGW